jgi:hypothetical protein
MFAQQDSYSEQKGHKETADRGETFAACFRPASSGGSVLVL